MVVASYELPVASRLLLRLLGLHAGGDGLADEHEGAVGARERALDQQQVLFGVDLDEGVVAGGDAGVAHVAGHAEALLGFAGVAAVGGVGGDGAAGAMLALGAVRG